MADEVKTSGVGGVNASGQLRSFVSRETIGDICLMFDMLTIVCAATLAKWLYIDIYLGVDQPLDMYLAAAAAGSAAAVLCLRYQGAYRFEALIQAHGQVGPILTGITVTGVALTTFGYFLKVGDDFSRVWFVLWLGLSTFGLLIFHFHFRWILSRALARGMLVRHVAVYGSGSIAAALSERLRHDDSGVHLVGIFDDVAADVIQCCGVNGGIGALIEFAQKDRLDEVILALPMDRTTQISSVMMHLSALPVDVQLCPSPAPLSVLPDRISSCDGLPILGLVRKPMDGWARLLKAIEDRLLAAAILIIIAPFLLMIALLIKLDSPGPVVFRQRRHGFNHSIFDVYKFRTMSVLENDHQVVQAKRDDPRLTRVGPFLRRTSLDELPQLFNVLKGDMSLVGPRPHAIAHNEHYAKFLDGYASRHRVKPGITGWAQVHGLRGETDTPEKMEKRVVYDLYYIDNWSIWLDMKILVMTLFRGFTGSNAY
ncbi:undecaprenyl-phosphate glucose phosphotransferase [Parvibaculum sp.]|uniref:undecaprenyl-phosphate glucose phosphotransferase n=1 Tax=Parvibaculum sp. TaxID=2024848 RepID=UPI002626F140|nr:undecaprenyl-phosphate glucose phosphotransferase [Parvibaculum sp.]MCW5726929.1 undecaprenyl-phosphate glucose phosphotransferase [Parvibaculum sp.]